VFLNTRKRRKPLQDRMIWVKAIPVQGIEDGGVALECISVRLAPCEIHVGKLGGVYEACW